MINEYKIWNIDIGKEVIEFLLYGDVMVCNIKWEMN